MDQYIHLLFSFLQIPQRVVMTNWGNSKLLTLHDLSKMTQSGCILIDTVMDRNALNV